MNFANRPAESHSIKTELKISRSSADDKIIALCGNPNVGKSTVFNRITGLNQHTGNWPGKTVAAAQGICKYKDKSFILVDIPGTYSLAANSPEEEIARDFICFENPDAVIIVADATCLQRNLNLVLQTLEITRNAVVCVNLLDEARKKKIIVNLKELSEQLGVPVVGTAARSGKGINELMDAVYMTVNAKASVQPLRINYGDAVEKAIDMLSDKIKTLSGNRLNSRWVALKLLCMDTSFSESIKKHFNSDLPAIENQLKKARDILRERGIDPVFLHDIISSAIVCTAEKIFDKSVIFENEKCHYIDRKIDNIVTSKIWGIPIMLGFLVIVFWITISGANVLSQIISAALFWFQDRLNDFLLFVDTPRRLHDMLVFGIYRTLAWVISVMLPPMAIFFPLFALLEDLGYLPRIAFNLDNFFKKSCAHGKQALTMCMGFGCNAAGVVGCRIIDSPREKLIAAITNNFVPCNGRFPGLIAIITIFFSGAAGGKHQSAVSALLLTCVIVSCVFITLVISKILSKTILKGLPSSFALELPPYRKPQIGKVIIRSIFDKTLFVLGRAVCVAAPAGLIIWILANTNIGNASLLSHCAALADPFAKLIGLDGHILMAFILGFPANEIVIPIIIMSYTATGSIIELDSLNQLRQLLIMHGWTWLTAVCFILFSLMHWPCGTTCWTIKKETQSWKWTAVSFIVPSITGVVICFIAASSARLLGLA